MQKINVQKIMEEIREEIKEKGYTEDMLSFHEIPVRTDQILDAIPAENKTIFTSTINQVRNASYIPWYRPVPNGIKGFIKKVIRKCVGFVVAPITDDQNIYNSLNITLVEQLCNRVEEQQEQILKLEKCIADLNKNK
ncbi:hypothetical protein [Velocimicrobium porci]|uniref:Uncharacterized protein n=1 Tax=Velocimicrobium porci TaxID=2606634 RepID=A0A6L5Y0V6_9FIRM|nr:hypothetical protein [Velocimicrobium porci]MSS64499.1 hypothetical protein [Velocimicrobium porci]